MRLLTLLLLLPCCSIGQDIFQKVFDDSPYGWAQQTNDGGFLLVGRGIAKLDSNYNFEWQKAHIFGPNYWAATTTTDGGYIATGSTGGNAVLVKFDAQGDTMWTKAYGDSFSDRGWAVQQTMDGGYVMAGSTQSFNGAWIVRTYANGDTIWTRVIGAVIIGSQSARSSSSIYQLQDGTFIMSAVGISKVHLIKLDTLGDTLWTRSYSKMDAAFSSAEKLVVTSDGGYLIMGHYPNPNNGENDIMVVRTDGVGDTLWTKVYGGLRYYNGYDIKETKDGGFVIVGFGAITGPLAEDIFLLKADAVGDTLWTRAYGAAGEERGYNVLELQEGGYLILGWTNSFGGSGMYLIKVDENGKSGCHEYPTLCTVMPAPKIITAGLSLGSGAKYQPVSMTILDTTIVDSTLCYGVGINQYVETVGLAIYPNPTTGMFTITGQAPVQVFDLLGRQIASPPKADRNDGIEVDLSGYRPGVYLVKVGDSTTKLILTQ